MTVIIPEGFAQVTLNYASGDFESGVAATVLGFDIQGAVSPGLGGIAADIGSNFIDNVLPLMSSNTSLTSVRLVTSDSAVDATTTAAGDYTTTQAPPNFAVLARKVTIARGRRAQGRCYFPSMAADGDVDSDGTIDPARRDLISDALDAFMAQLEEDGLVMVILQNEEGDTPPLSPPPDVTGLSVQAKGGTQRGRMR